MQRAFSLEDLAQNQNSSKREFRRSSQYDGLCKSCYSPKLEWYWKCVIFPWGLRALSILLIIFSAVVVWSECLFFIQSPTLSIFALFLELAKNTYNYIAIEIMCICTMAYLSVTAYYTVFKVRFFNYYYLAGHHQTNEYSLLFCGMMLTRLTPPLCLNFLGLIHMDSHVTKQEFVVQTSFTKIMGHMDVIKFISDGFNIYYPIAIVLLCFATYFNLCGRVLHFLGFQQFMSDDEMTQELVDEGKNLVTRDRRRQERFEENAARRREWNERFGSNSRSSRNNLEQEMDQPSANSSQVSAGGASRKRPSSEYGSTLHEQNRPMSASAQFKLTTQCSNKKNSKKLKDKRKQVDDDVYMVTDGKHTVARSPQENDRSNLLREVEPVGYTDPPTRDPFRDDPFQDESLNGETGVHTSGSGYQSRAIRPSSLRMAMGSSTAGKGQQPGGPPKGIFDDI